MVILMNLKSFFNNFFVGFSPKPKDDFSILPTEDDSSSNINSSNLLQGNSNSSTITKELSFNIRDNLNTIKSIYNTLIAMW